MYPKQFASMYCAARYSLIEATTKAGKTWSALVWLLEKAMTGKAGQNFWWVSPVFSQAKIVFRRLKRSLPAEMFASSEHELTITLANGTVIWFKGSDNPDTLYGEDVFAAVIDEASRVKEDAWYAVRTTLTHTQGPARIIGNVKGRKNWFYKLARKAQAGDPSMAYHKITAKDAVKAGILKQSEIDDAKSKLPANVFKQLYEAEPATDEGNPFGIEAIQAAAGPLSNKPPVFWGWDLAKSVDWTVGIALDSEGVVCRFLRFQKPWPETIEAIRVATGRAPALVDSTGVGDPILAQLQRTGGNFQGYVFTSPSKQKLMEGLASSIQHSKIRYPDGVIVLELEAFEYQYTATGVRYCVAPNMKILTADLRWVKASDIWVGQKLLAFDENGEGLGARRKYRESVVTGCQTIMQPCYRLTMEDGTVLEVSREHLWLIEAGGKARWEKTMYLRAPHSTSRSKRSAPHHLMKLFPVWKTDRSYEAGYLAATLDGEGHISQAFKPGSRGHSARIGFAQKDNEMAAHARKYMKARGFLWSEGGKGGTNRDVLRFSIKGRREEFVRFLGQIRPKRLLSRFDPNKLGQIENIGQVKIMAIEFLGERPVIALGTTTKTFICEGFASHNSAPDGMHDDCVCSLALVNHLAERGSRRFTAELI